MSVTVHMDARYVGCHRFAGPAGRVLSERRDDLGEIIVVLRGAYQALFRRDRRDITVTAGAGEVVLCPPHVWRLETSVPDQPLHCAAIYFRGSLLAGLPLKVRDHGGLIHTLADRMLSLKGEAIGEDSMQAFYAAYTNAILTEYARIAHMATDTLVPRVARFIEENMRQPLTLRALAKGIGLEQHHLGRRYRRLTGHTPMDEARRRKAAHARDMLLTIPSRDLKEVGASVGILNPKRLVRLINRYSGMRVRDIRRLGVSSGNATA